MICASKGLRAYEGVNAHIQGSTCEQHTTTDIVAPKTQTTSPLAARFQRFSPRWSAVWAPYHLEPRPRRRQSGGIALHGGPTRRRHAAEGRRVVQNPHRSQHEVRRIAHKSWAQHRSARKTRPTPPLRRLFREKTRPARPLPRLFRDKTRPARIKPQFQAILSAQGELFRAFTI